MTRPETLEDALREIERLRAEIRALFSSMENSEHPVSRKHSDALILYGDVRPGHEFDVV